MRALHVPAVGEKPQLGEVPVPSVAEGTVLVRVKAAGLNPIDNVIAGGFMSEMVPHEYPVVLGRDAAGIVEAVGAGVDHVEPGDEVFGHVLIAPPIQAGTLAEYALLPAVSVVPKPARLSFVEAAALPLSTAAASQAVEAIDSQTGQVVLINGASGGVGSYAIQLLAARGVTVVATGTAADVERLTTLGAGLVIDHTAGPVADQVLARYPKGVDALVNLFGNASADVPLAAVRKGGAVSSLAMAPDAEAAAEAGLTFTKVMAKAVGQVTGPVAEQAAAGTIKVDVQRVVPLEKAAEGLATILAGQAKGKIVVTLEN